MTVAVMSLTVFLTLQWKYWPYAAVYVDGRSVRSVGR